MPRPRLVTVAEAPFNKLSIEVIKEVLRLACIFGVTFVMVFFKIGSTFMAFSDCFCLAIDLITKRHECSIFLY